MSNDENEAVASAAPAEGKEPGTDGEDLTVPRGGGSCFPLMPVCATTDETIQSRYGRPETKADEPNRHQADAPSQTRWLIPKADFAAARGHYYAPQGIIRAEKA